MLSIEKMNLLRQAKTGLNLNLHKLVYKIDSITSKVLNSVDLNISNSQYLVMKSIFILNNASQKEISEFLGISEAAISRHIKNLYSKNYINKVVKNKNSKISLTSQGEKIFLKSINLLQKELKKEIKNYNKLSLEIYKSANEKDK